MSDVLEAVGVLLVATFAYFVWAPLALLVVGVFLLVAGFALDGTRLPGRSKKGDS